MYKKITLAALAAISVSAFAQSGANDTATITTSAYINTHPWCPGNVSLDGKSTWDLRKRVQKQADVCLSGGDRFRLEYMLDRNPFEVNAALLRGLCNAERQAVAITTRILTQRFPDDATYAVDPSTLQANNLSWGSEGRPLRIVMTNPVHHKDVSYDDALSILCMNLPSDQASILSGWWYGDTGRGVAGSDITEEQKDIVCRLLEDDAKMADETFYPSVYMHPTYSWLNAAPPF